MKIDMAQDINIGTLLDRFFTEHSDIESWLKVIYFLMFKKGVTSFNIDEKHLEIYVKNGDLNIIYQTEEKRK